MKEIARFLSEHADWFIMLTIIAAAVIPSFLREHRYNRSPEFESQARLVSKRMGYDQSGRNLYEVYYGTFETSGGEVVEVRMPRDSYHLIREGDSGRLIWMGGKMEDFRGDEEERA